MFKQVFTENGVLIQDAKIIESSNKDAEKFLQIAVDYYRATGSVIIKTEDGTNFWVSGIYPFNKEKSYSFFIKNTKDILWFYKYAYSITPSKDIYRSYFFVSNQSMKHTEPFDSPKCAELLNILDYQ